jgi:hypothetical protein
MRKEHIHHPDDFDTVEGKLRVVNESLDGLLVGTEAYRLRQDAVEWMAAATASLIVLHQVIEAMLNDELR